MGPQAGANLRFLGAIALSQTPVYAAIDHGYSASRGVPVYVPAFAGAHWARRDGQAELIWDATAWDGIATAAAKKMLGL